MGQSQSGQAGFPGQGQQGEKKDQAKILTDCPSNDVTHCSQKPIPLHKRKNNNVFVD